MIQVGLIPSRCRHDVSYPPPIIHPPLIFLHDLSLVPSDLYKSRRVERARVRAKLKCERRVGTLINPLLATAQSGGSRNTIIIIIATAMTSKAATALSVGLTYPPIGAIALITQSLPRRLRKLGPAGMVQRRA